MVVATKTSHFLFSKMDEQGFFLQVHFVVLPSLTMIPFREVVPLKACLQLLALPYHGTVCGCLQWPLHAFKRYHFSPSFVKGPSEPKWECRGDCNEHDADWLTDFLSNGESNSPRKPANAAVLALFGKIFIYFNFFCGNFTGILK